MNSSTPPNTAYQARFAKLQHITERLPNQPSHDKAIWRDSTGTLRAKLGEQAVTSKLWPIFSHRAGVPLPTLLKPIWVKVVSSLNLQPWKTHATLPTTAC